LGGRLRVLNRSPIGIGWIPIRRGDSDWCVALAFDRETDPDPDQDQAGDAVDHSLDPRAAEHVGEADGSQRVAAHPEDIEAMKMPPSISICRSAELCGETNCGSRLVKKIRPSGWRDY